MTLLYEDLLFDTAPAVKPTDEVPDWTPTEMDIHMISLLRLPEDTNLRCDNVKMTMPKSNIQKLELWDADGEKIKDIQLNEELDIPLYIFQYTPLCIKVKFADDVPISPEVEMIYSAGLLQPKYRKDRTITFPITPSYT